MLCGIFVKDEMSSLFFFLYFLENGAFAALDIVTKKRLHLILWEQASKLFAVSFIRSCFV